MQITATTFSGLEEILAKEITALGGSNTKLHKRAVTFEGDKKIIYKCIYELRTALRIFLPFHTFKTKHENHLYKKVREVDWTEIMDLDDTFAINGTTSSKYITHSKYLALKTKDAIVDQFRSKYNGLRLSVDRDNPDHRLNVHLGYDNVCTLSWDVSGDTLNRRGYRTATGEAPINEVLAAGIILSSNWQKDCDFIDPMCGSGTFLIEAAMIARNIPPQINRRSFGFMRYKDFDKALWEEVKKEADAKITDFPHQIVGFDKDFKAMKIARMNVLAANLDGKIEVERGDLLKISALSDKGILVMNPPYDERLQVADVNAFYKDIGHALKHNFNGYDAWIISANIKAMKQLGLRPSYKKILFNGALECQLAHYELYRGSRK